ncbi:Clp protease N-terminal domain-containing protein [Actinomycetospora termitidis]|uniref:Clp protease N-terminal domain-containing protein n=1 Tax=Actinomycetospora termitidis TaxID=3053470 RepID=A0ABT7MAI4_9PSEU|nr:Clp protease N-terminal domain-containing protein [Actinomycetospora sp. Odt1-22]MDL5157666.1 Clp protease N-terminal domain-containing protein [Actinomycetospora sp. Odt1-22]
MALPTAEPRVPGAAPRPQLSADVARVLDLARDEAVERGHRWIGTAHLLRAVVHVDGPEAGLLAAAGVTDRGSDTALTLAVWSAAGEPDPSGPPGPATANDAVHEVLAAAHVRAAGAERDVSVSDLLTALLRHGGDQAADMLATLGADADRLLDALGGLDALSAPVAPTRRLVPRDPGGLLSTAWRDAARSA